MLKLPEMYSLKTVLDAIIESAGSEAIITERTLREIVRNKGLSRGRGRRLMFSAEQAAFFQEKVICQ